MINKNFNVIEVVDSDATTKNEVFPNNTIITFYNDASKFKISDGKTAFNDLNYFGESGGETITLENGLRLQDGVGKMGLDLFTIGTTNEGLLTEDTYLIRGDILSINSGITIRSSSISFATTDVNFNSSGVRASETIAIIGKFDMASTPLQVLEFDVSNNIVLTDITNSKGIEYAADYSENFTDRSLVDKEFVNTVAVLNTKLNTSANDDTVPLRKTDGRVEVGTATDGADAINLTLLNERIPTAPLTGNYTLKSADGIVSWVEDV